jgi:hypothetical protein
MIAILRLFRAVRNLEEHCKVQDEQIFRLRTAWDTARAQLDASNARNDALVDRLDESRKDQIRKTETVADFGFQLKYGRKLFDSVPELPDMSTTPDFEPVQSRPQAYDQMKELEREFYENLNNTAHKQSQ